MASGSLPSPYGVPWTLPWLEAAQVVDGNPPRADVVEVSEAEDAAWAATAAAYQAAPEAAAAAARNAAAADTDTPALKAAAAASAELSTAATASMEATTVATSHTSGSSASEASGAVMTPEPEAAPMDVDAAPALAAAAAAAGAAEEVDDEAAAGPAADEAQPLEEEAEVEAAEEGEEQQWVVLGGMLVRPRCPCCDAPALSLEEYQAAHKTGRPNPHDALDPRNKPEHALTPDFLQRHIIDAGMSLRELAFFHGWGPSTTCRMMKKLGLLNPRV